MSAYVLVIAPRVPTIHTCRITVDINVRACTPGYKVATAARALPKINALSPNVFPSLIFSTGLLLNIIITCKQTKPSRRAPLSAHRASNLPSQTGHLPLSRERLSRACPLSTAAAYYCRAGVHAVRIHSHNIQRAACNALRAASERQEPARHCRTDRRLSAELEKPMRTFARARDGMERTSPWIKMYIACAISPSR